MALVLGPDLTLSDAEIAVLAHVVTDAVAWAQHAYATVGRGAVAAKIDRYRAAYDAAVAADGVNYQNRAQRDAAAALPAPAPPLALSQVLAGALALASAKGTWDEARPEFQKLVAALQSK